MGLPPGYLSHEVGWVVFFFVTFLAALPGLALLYKMRRHILSLEHFQDADDKHSSP